MFLLSGQGKVYNFITISMYLGAVVSSRADSWFYHRIYITVTVIAVGETDLHLRKIILKKSISFLDITINK